jgi:hypothetical protein
VSKFPLAEYRPGTYAQVKGALSAILLHVPLLAPKFHDEVKKQLEESLGVTVATFVELQLSGTSTVSGIVAT